MKRTNVITRTLRALTGIALMLTVIVIARPAAHAATRIKQDNTTDLNLAGSWDTLPGAADIAQWSSIVTGENTTVLGADLSWAGIKIVGPGGAVTIGSGNTLTLGTSGIDLSAATTNLTFNCGLTLRGTGQQSWKAASGRTLNVAGTFTRTGAVVDFTGFNTNATLGGLANDASGILGPWAMTGSGTSLNYVTNSTAGAISAFTNQTPATAADLSNVTDPNVNYSLAKLAGGTTLTGNIIANTLRVISTSDNAITNAGNSITLNGLIGVPANRTIITGPGNLVIGATKELVVNWTVGFSTIACPVVNNPGGASSVIINCPNGEYTFGGNSVVGVTSTYTGGTILNFPAGGQINCYANGFGTGPITVNGGALRVAYKDGGTVSNSFVINGVDYISAGTFAGPITLNASASVRANVSGNISGPGGVSFNVASVTRLFSGTNTYTGPTTVSLGTLKAGRASVANVSGAFGLNSAVSMANAAATFDLNGFDTQIGSLTGGGATGGNVTNSSATTAATLTVGGDNTSPTNYAGCILGPRLGLTKIGAGTLALGGTNTYAGITTVSGGTLALTSAGSLKFFPTSNGVCNKITGAGTANLDGTFNIDLTGAAITNGNSWTLVDVATKTYGGTFAVSGFTGAAGVWTKTDGTNTWTFTQATGVLTISSGVSAPTVSGITKDGLGNVVISGISTGSGVITEKSTNLAASPIVWTAVSTNPVMGGAFSITNSQGTDPRAFFRVKNQ